MSVKLVGEDQAKASSAYEESEALLLETLLALALEPKPFRYSREPDPFGWAVEEPAPVYCL